MAETIEQLLVRKIQGECSPVEEVEFMAWISESEENRNTYFQYKMLWHARKVPTYSADSSSKKALKEFNRRIDGLLVKESRSRIYNYLKYAAILLALVGLPALFWFVKSSMNQVHHLSEVVSSRGELRVINLADGTRVWLNHNSTLNFPEKFGKGERVVHLDGEAFLDVKKDPEHPFIVKTQTVQIKVLGTSFNVNTRIEGDLVQTTLVEGSVVLLDESGERIAALKPGQMAAVNKVSKKVNIKDVLTKDYISWQSGIISMEKADLHEIISKIEEVYKIKIELNSKLLSKDKIQKKYNFVFRRSQSVDTVFEMLRFLAPVKYVQNGKNLKK